MTPVPVYRSTHKIRLVTAASLFDGHDAAINIMRRILQGSGAEIIHLGHNRSVQEIVDTALQEDVQGIAVTSYQGGHIEFFTYMRRLLDERGAAHIRIVGGGGGTILPAEIEQLAEGNIARIYSPDDGREMGLQGMINEVLMQCDFPSGEGALPDDLSQLQDAAALAHCISAVENYPEQNKGWMQWVHDQLPADLCPVLGITGTGGAGKSSLVDELLRRFIADFPGKRIAILSVDPSKRKTGGALLGDRIRMNSAYHPQVFMRSMATRQANLALSPSVQATLDLYQHAGFDLILLETSGIGQSDTEIVDFSDFSLYVMTPEYGAASQLEKIDMLDFAGAVALNKFDKRGAADALRDVRKQFQRNHQLWEQPLEEMPVFGTIASQFNDAGTNALYLNLLTQLEHRQAGKWKPEHEWPVDEREKLYIIPPGRVRYLSEIAENNRRYDSWAKEQVKLARGLYALRKTLDLLPPDDAARSSVETLYLETKSHIDPECQDALSGWDALKRQYEAPQMSYAVRGKTIAVDNYLNSLSNTAIPKVALPPFEEDGEILRWLLQENLPGYFPYTAGVFPFKRRQEDPTRMFAGEGNPERTNRRFHYLSKGMPAARLSTAFDSVTLYGENPDRRPDIYGKIGNSGVSVCSLDDAKRLYSGFDLCNPATSVSMTINGPAAAVCAFFMNAAIDQQCELYIRENKLEQEVEAALRKKYEDRGLERPAYRGALPEGHNGLGLMLLRITGDKVLKPDIYQRIKSQALGAVRGTVQADILKEDQAQNTCIFSTEFSLRLMGDMQAYFIDHQVRNFYSVSISGYHIAEAGANPITQLAFTLANGFTYVEYYLSRGMEIDDFAPNLSFFFSNGLDPEYAVIGRVARRIWAKALKHKYGADERSQKLKYHIQTSGRSLHAQEISFNDIRTTLQALYAIYDNCNSLHTNAYDEAITTPTEESVRRALAIQLIINHELGQAKNENPLQGSYIIEQLTDLVEEAVLLEFDRLTERGGVLGAMETMYQRGKIQEESLHYEHLKHSGQYPVIGVNTFLSAEGSPTLIPEEVIRSTEAEKEGQIHSLEQLHQAEALSSAVYLKRLKQTAVQQGNTFETLMEAVKVCSLGQITQALYEVGGQYRRNM